MTTTTPTRESPKPGSLWKVSGHAPYRLAGFTFLTDKAQKSWDGYDTSYVEGIFMYVGPVNLEGLLQNHSADPKQIILDFGRYVQGFPVAFEFLTANGTKIILPIEDFWKAAEPAYDKK